MMMRSSGTALASASTLSLGLSVLRLMMSRVRPFASSTFKSANCFSSSVSVGAQRKPRIPTKRLSLASFSMLAAKSGVPISTLPTRPRYRGSPLTRSRTRKFSFTVGLASTMTTPVMPFFLATSLYSAGMTSR